jgi:hypothetical protein
MVFMIFLSRSPLLDEEVLLVRGPGSRRQEHQASLPRVELPGFFALFPSCFQALIAMSIECDTRETVRLHDSDES